MYYGFKSRFLWDQTNTKREEEERKRDDKKIGDSHAIASRNFSFIFLL